MKYKVLQDITLTVKKDSIVILSDKQAQSAGKYIKPIKESGKNGQAKNSD